MATKTYRVSRTWLIVDSGKEKALLGIHTLHAGVAAYSGGGVSAYEIDKSRSG